MALGRRTGLQIKAHQPSLPRLPRQLSSYAFVMDETLTRTSFEPHLNTTFRVVHDGAETFELELIEVADKTPAGFPGEQFSLLFKESSDLMLLQQSCTLEHPEMGQIILFLVPVGQQKDGYRYEAFFNNATLDDE